MDIYNKPTDSKLCIRFTLNHPRHCLIIIPFSLARKVCINDENKNLKEERFKEIKKNTAGTKVP